MEKGRLLYEGKAKFVFETSVEGTLWVQYKDSATAFNGEKKATIQGKGRLNNEISCTIFNMLTESGVENHLVQRVSETEQLVQQLEIIPLEVVVRNVIAGSLAKRLGMEEGTALPQPIVEFYYKDDALGDPFINEDHIAILEAATEEEITFLKAQALKINAVLLPFFQDKSIKLVDFKLEFGRLADGSILLGDEISPDTCRLWDAETNEKLDKDVFRRDLGDLTTVYEEILKRLGGPSHV